MDIANIAQCITGIVDISLKIKRIVDTVKTNKEQSTILYQRVKIIADLVQQLQTKASKGDELLTKHSREASAANALKTSMQVTKQCLEECFSFLQNFCGAKWYKRVITHGSDKEKFAELNKQLIENIHIFDLAVGIDSNIKQALDREQEIEAERQDSVALHDMCDLILQEHVKEQRALQKIYAIQKNLQSKIDLSEVAVQRDQEFLQLQLQAIQDTLQNLGKSAAAKQQPNLPVDEKLLINIAALNNKAFLAEGSNATVYVGELYGIEVAIKILRNPTVQLVSELYRESAILARFDNPYIIKCRGVSIEQGRECLVMELMQNGSLEKYLNDPKQPLITELQQRWALEIAQGIDFVHQQHIIHRDLKTANILLSADGHAKLADFDLAELTEPWSDNALATVAYTSKALAYMAPELQAKDGKASFASDIYSYGVILWEIITKQPPPEDKDKKLLSQIPEPYKSIIARCWSNIPTQRPSIEEIIETIANNPFPDCLDPCQSTATLYIAASAPAALPAATSVSAESHIAANDTVSASHREPTAELQVGISAPVALPVAANVSAESHMAVSDTVSASHRELTAELQAGASAPAALPAAVSIATESSAAASTAMGSSYIDPYKLGVQCYNRGQYKEALQYFLQVNCNNIHPYYPAACLSLWFIYKTGKGVSKDLSRAEVYGETIKNYITWFRRQAEIGNENAQYNLGLLHKYGIGLTEDHTQAKHWFKQAADQGHTHAQFSFAVMCYKSKGDDRNFANAYDYFKQAADQGHALAQFNFAVMCYNGKGCKRDHKMAYEYFTKAAIQGHAYAQYNLGLMLYDKKDDNKLREAVSWFIKAAAQKNKYAQFKLGMMFAKEIVVNLDYTKARYWFTKAAKQGYFDAQINLGSLYVRGLGGDKDYGEAEYWFNQALEQGYEEASSKLRRLRHMKRKCFPQPTVIFRHTFTHKNLTLSYCSEQSHEEDESKLRAMRNLSGL